jgi:hypothetical protein
MADGDIVHNRLGRIYQKPYKVLCEGKASTGECARDVMNALRQDLKKKGDLPIKLAQYMGEKLHQVLVASAGNSSVDWSTLNRDLEKIVQRVDGWTDLKELTLRAGKKVLHDLRYGLVTSIHNPSATILQQYINEVYESGFKECIPLTSEHHAGVNEATLARRIENIQSDLCHAISIWAKKADLDGSMANLRLPPRPQINKVDLDEDLCVAS